MLVSLICTCMQIVFRKDQPDESSKKAVEALMRIMRYQRAQAPDKDVLVRMVSATQLDTKYVLEAWKKTGLISNGDIITRKVDTKKLEARGYTSVVNNHTIEGLDPDQFDYKMFYGFKNGDQVGVPCDPLMALYDEVFNQPTGKPYGHLLVDASSTYVNVGQRGECLTTMVGIGAIRCAMTIHGCPVSKTWTQSPI
jgi:hypothetical protein